MLNIIQVIINAAKASQEYKNDFLYKSWNRRYTKTDPEWILQWLPEIWRGPFSYCMLSHSILQQIPWDASQETEQEIMPLSLHAALKSFCSQARITGRHTTFQDLTCQETNTATTIFSSLCAGDKRDKDFLFTSVKTDTLSNSSQNISNHPAFLPERQPPGRPSLTETGQ